MCVQSSGARRGDGSTPGEDGVGAAATARAHAHAHTCAIANATLNDPSYTNHVSMTARRAPPAWESLHRIIAAVMVEVTAAAKAQSLTEKPVGKACLSRTTM